MKRDIPILLVEDDDVDVENVVRAFEENKISNPLYVTGNGEEALDFLRHEGAYLTSPPTPLLRGEGSLSPPSLAEKGAGGLGSVYDPDKAPQPGIILLDINMPIMDGIEFLRVVKHDDDLKRIPVIVLTTSQEERDRVESFTLSVAGYIVKPVEFEEFVKVVQVIDVYWTLSEVR